MDKLDEFIKKLKEIGFTENNLIIENYFVQQNQEVICDILSISFYILYIMKEIEEKKLTICIYNIKDDLIFASHYNSFLIKDVEINLKHSFKRILETLPNNIIRKYKIDKLLKI